MIQQREDLRSRRKYDEADAIREQLARQGVHLKDTPQGVRWRLDGPEAVDDV